MLLMRDFNEYFLPSVDNTICREVGSAFQLRDWLFSAELISRRDIMELIKRAGLCKHIYVQVTAEIHFKD